MQFHYNDISLIYHMWVHLHILKHSGAAHYPGGVESLHDGSMAVECPTCPHPGCNVDAQNFLSHTYHHLFDQNSSGWYSSKEVLSTSYSPRRT